MDGPNLATRLTPYHRFGPFAGLLAVAKRLSHRWLEWGEIVVVEMPLRARSPIGPSDIVVRVAERQDLPALAEAFVRSAAELRARLDRGDRCYVGYRGAEPLHMRWITDRPTEVPEVGLWLWPEPGTIYVYDAVTCPSARGAGLSGQVGAVMDDVLVGEGLRAKVCYVRADNHAMWHALRRVPGPLVIRGRLSYVRRHGRSPRILGQPPPPLSARPPRGVAALSVAAPPSTSATM